MFTQCPIIFSLEGIMTGISVNDNYMFQSNYHRLSQRRRHTCTTER